MKKCTLAILALIILSSVCPIFAQDYYQKGNTLFSVKAGISIPAFVKFFDNQTVDSKSFPDKMHTKIGGFGALSYQVFLTSKILLGGELGYGFNYSQASKILTTVPIVARFSYAPVQTGKFDLFLSSSAGFTFNRYDKTKRWMPYLSLSVTPMYYIGQNWGLGLDAGIWFDLELHSSKMKQANALMSMIPVTLSLAYRK